MPTRKELQDEFVSLRNAQLKRPPSSNTRLRNLYLDHLIESDELAEVGSDEELAQDIERMRRG